MSAEEKKERLIVAAGALYDDYVNDPELTIFCCLDSEDFCETTEAE